MDNIYEFQNNIFDSAALKLKALAYDIIIESGEKKTDLLHSDNKQEMLLEELSKIDGNIINLTKQLEEELRKLDQYCQKVDKLVNKDSLVMKIDTFKNKKESDKENTPSIKPTLIATHKKENNEIDSIKQEDISIKERLNDNNVIASENNNMKVEKEKEFHSEIPAVKKVFQKTTKNSSKAIMVRKNQLENLKNSKKLQEQLLIDRGVFSKDNEITNEKNATKKTKIPLPDNIERQIEDLMVKANIYYNEGEKEKAQELYDQINRLTNDV